MTTLAQTAKASVYFIKNICYTAIKNAFPSKTISTFFGTGYLPEWQSHWASLLTIPIVILITYVCTSFEGSIADLSFPALVSAVIALAFGTLSIHLLLMKESDVDDEIMIHTVFGQVVVLSLSGPAVIAIGYNIVDFNNFICEKFLYCKPWFYTTITYIPIFLIPYFAYRFVDIIKPWPASLLDKEYNNPLSNMLEGLVNALYTLLFLYLSSFMLFDLLMSEALLFFSELFKKFHFTI